MVRRIRTDGKGQATVEMAVILPILLMLLLGLVDVARMANAYLTVQHAAREAVRAGTTGASDAEVTQRARDSMVALEPNRITISISPPGARTTGGDITVTISYRYQFLVALGYAGAEVTITGQLTGRVE
jgi:Flp pilus assembly protein TadG